MTDPTDTLLSRRKARDRSIALLLVAIVLLLPPVVGVAQIDARVGGLPIIVIYVFGVWALLIAVARRLSGPLRDSEQRPVTTDATSTGD